MLEASVGRASHLNLSIVGLENEISRLSERWGLHTPVNIKDKNFLKFVRTKAINFNEVVIIIPFVNTDRYRLYRVEPLPMITNESRDFKFMVDIPSSYAAVKFDRRLAGIIKNYDDCYQPNTKISLCPQFLELSNSIYNQDCVLQIALNLNLTNCELVKVPIQKTQIIELNRVIVLSSIPGDRITTRCYNETRDIIIPSSGLLFKNPNCQITGNWFNFQPVKRYRSNFTTHLSLSHEAFQINNEQFIAKVKQILHQTKSFDSWNITTPNHTMLTLVVIALVLSILSLIIQACKIYMYREIRSVNGVELQKVSTEET